MTLHNLGEQRAYLVTAVESATRVENRPGQRREWYAVPDHRPRYPPGPLDDDEGAAESFAPLWHHHMNPGIGRDVPETETSARLEPTDHRAGAGAEQRRFDELPSRRRHVTK
ncbi:hypothetical protein [Actinophytocola glycyrrhizae]|uniref:Uncharacterized protein n=1 Tax=Actinophytocola glycyrrhizae TaxID=2044873 RepID=A0ABV9SDY6_9PSEU